MFKGKSFFGIKYGSNDQEKQVIFEEERAAISADFLADGRGTKPHGPPICFVFREEDSRLKAKLDYGSSGVAVKKERQDAQLELKLIQQGKSPHNFFRDSFSKDKYYTLSSGGEVVFRTYDTSLPFLKMINPKKWFSAACETLADNIQEDIQDAAESKPCCENVTKKCSDFFSFVLEERLHFVVVYPMNKVLDARAETEQYYVKLNAVELLDKHNLYWEKHRDKLLKDSVLSNLKIKKIRTLIKTRILIRTYTRHSIRPTWNFKM